MKQNTVVITSIYSPFWGTKQFEKSVNKVGYPLINSFAPPIVNDGFKGNGTSIRMIYESLLELRRKYKYAIYADGADSYFVKQFEVPDFILYSTEKAVWPPTTEMNEAWQEYYNIRSVPTPWKYLNGGGYCGPISLLIEFFERYGLNKLIGDCNGQREQSLAFLQAFKDKFPIHLDWLCENFQTTGFADPGEFAIDKDTLKITNFRTQTEPALFHGNGRTNMDWLYNLYK